MAEITDVYLKIIYKKDNKLMREDLLNDEELVGILLDLEYDGVEYGHISSLCRIYMLCK